MKSLRILALSSSRAGNGAYLQTALPAIKSFLSKKNLRIAFVPFASVDTDYEAYTNKVREALAPLPYSVQTAGPDNAKEIIGQSNAIMVGGGNTFKLLHNLYHLNVLEVIQQKVRGGTPYIGWSAGSNITGATISTTNDMPIIQPQSFKALRFFSFQINPHYYNAAPQGFHGETRDQRLEEFLRLNSAAAVVCLPEGTALKLEDGVLTFLGQSSGVLMTRENEKLVRTELIPATDLSGLL